MRLGIVGDVQGNEIRLAQHVIQIRVNRAGFLRRRQARPVPINHPHVESLRAPGNRATNPSEADDAERRAGDIGSEQLQRLPAGPFVSANQPLALAYPPRHIHQ